MFYHAWSFCKYILFNWFKVFNSRHKRPRNFPDLQFSVMKTNHYWMRSFCRGLAFILLVRVQTFVRQMINWNVMFSWFWIAHFKVAGENEAGVDLVLIQPFLLYYVNHVFLMLTSIFLNKIYIIKEWGLYQNKVNLSLTFSKRLGHQAHNCKMAMCTGL